MLLIHGLVGSSENWRNNIAALAQNASVYAIDLVNNGKSQRIHGLDVSLRATANRIIAIMDALGLAAADIVAHSHGVSVALMLAALYPARVRRLILFAPANPYSRSSDRMVRVYSSPFGIVLGRLIPYFPAPVQRLALGEVYGSPDRVADHSLQEIVDGLRCPATLRHVLSIIRCWFSEMDRLRYALRRVSADPYEILLVWGDRRQYREPRLGRPAETQITREAHCRAGRPPHGLRGKARGSEPDYAGVVRAPSILPTARTRRSRQPRFAAAQSIPNRRENHHRTGHAKSIP